MNGLTVPFCTTAFKGLVLQLLLTNAVPGFVLKEALCLPTTKIKKIPVARARCVMYYGLPFARNGKRPDLAWERHENDGFVVRTINVNFLMMRTVHVCA